MQRVTGLLYVVLLKKGEMSAGGDCGGGGRNWQGSVPNLWVIMCLTQDNVKGLFLARANTRLRQELDARNFQVR